MEKRGRGKEVKGKSNSNRNLWIVIIIIIAVIIISVIVYFNREQPGLGPINYDNSISDILRFNLSEKDPLVEIIVGSDDYRIELVSASDTSATINVNGVAKEIGESTSKNFGNIDVHLNSADETNFGLFGTISTIPMSSKFVLTDKNPLETIYYVGDSKLDYYQIRMASASDTSATINVNGDSKEINEGTSKTVGGLIIYVANADETNFGLSTTIALGNTGLLYADTDGGFFSKRAGVIFKNGDSLVKADKCVFDNSIREYYVGKNGIDNYPTIYSPIIKCDNKCVNKRVFSPDGKKSYVAGQCE